MKNIQEPNELILRNAANEVSFDQMLAQLRQDQLEAALAGRIAESAFFAAEAEALRQEFGQETALCA